MMNVEGNAQTPYDPARDIVGSSPIGNERLCFFTNGATASEPEASSEIARTTSPLSLYFRYRRSMPGISSSQGLHHVAQKFRKMTLPLNSARVSQRLSG